MRRLREAPSLIPPALQLVRSDLAICLRAADDAHLGHMAVMDAGPMEARGLADRIDALEGRLEVESPPGVGTRVSARLPLPASRAPMR
jgi:signal transduction histidine kinase